MTALSTQVCVAGAGPAGLVLAIALGRAGIDCTVVERRPRAYLEQQARAGFLEHRVVAYLREQGVAPGLDQGMSHARCEFRLPDRRFCLPYGELAGGFAHTVYPQHLLVADLIATLLAEGGKILFEYAITGVTGLDGDRPKVTCRADQGPPVDIACDLVAGCDGWRGVTRTAVPAGPRTVAVRYPFNWLTLLAEVPPDADQVVYALHDNGFAGQMPRTPKVSRFYLACPPESAVADWPDDRVWKELGERLSTGGAPAPRPGPILDKGMLAMRSAVTEPMQYGRLFLAGDSAHPLTPVGAKGMNLAIADAAHLAGAMTAYYRDGDESRLRGYSDSRLPLVWRAHEFSDRFLRMLHPAGSDYEDALGRSRWDQLERNSAAARVFAAEYVGSGPLIA
ncbi:4-hydroxybenzoate 3-monooxygenase [Hamadaea tsunoensis]|uniref:4-hydroxybenzoate 3-monooxygenase n=1 Tax=Hamadaea tsunoensis TaxID=53368 RepID=UPI0003FEFFF2|nr:4-hydroxybenzoate 3-monooxygenase [Hamadaea tsunoensis]